MNNPPPPERPGDEVMQMGLSALVPALAQLGVGCEIWARGSESLITRARNMAVADFLKTDCTHLLFTDVPVKQKATGQGS